MALDARQQVKIWKTRQLYRHYIAEIVLNVTLKPQPTNQRTAHGLMLCPIDLGVKRSNAAFYILDSPVTCYMKSLILVM